MTKYTIGFIDEEEEQRSLFYQEFKDQFNIVKIDPTEIEDPSDLITHYLKEDIDMFIIDYDMSSILEYNADTLESILEENNPHFPFLIGTSQPVPAFDHIVNPEIVYSKSIWGGENDEELKNFKTKLNKIIEKYKNTIISYEEELKILDEKIKEKGLTTSEEDRYVYLNKYIGELHGNPNNPNFYSVDTNKKLDTLIEKTENLLSKIGQGQG